MIAGKKSEYHGDKKALKAPDEYRAVGAFNRLIEAADVVKAMLEIKKDMDSDDRRAKELGLEEDGVAFYDAVAA